MAQSAVICAVCRRPRTSGFHDHVGDVFICADCEADATQFIEIQDSVWVEADEEGESTGEPGKPAYP